MTFIIDILLPTIKLRESGRLLVSILGGSLFLALMAQFSIPLWFTPVPITLQTLAVMLIGAYLGSKQGSFAILLYLAEGAIGLPVFAGHSFGFAVLMGPTGGYLFAFVFAAFFIGYLFEKGWKKTTLSISMALTLGSAIILGIGHLWLGLFVGMHNALLLGVYPFLVGSFVQILCASILINFGKSK